MNSINSLDFAALADEADAMAEQAHALAGLLRGEASAPLSVEQMAQGAETEQRA